MEPAAAGMRDPWPRARQVLGALAILALAGLASQAGSAFIASSYPDRPAPRDTLFELLPYLSAARYLTAIALVGAFALLIAYALRDARSQIPRFIALFGLMYLLRAAIMVLTPLASSYGDGSFVFPMVQNGMFPSGHAAAAYLCARLIPADRAPRLRAVQHALAAVVWIALILAHGHYSIDVVGGILLTYFVDQEWTHGRLFAPVKRLIGA